MIGARTQAALTAREAAGPRDRLAHSLSRIGEMPHALEYWHWSEPTEPIKIVNSDSMEEISKTK